MRLRFAPSPTGEIHIGTLRTALFNYIITKKLGGTLVLRIEDTDEKREIEGSKDRLIEVMSDLGIEFDEGPHVGGDFGPYVQSERKEIYKKHYNTLLEQGSAYRCFCSPERLDLVRLEQQAKKQAPRYNKHCRDLNSEEIEKRVSAGEGYVIRQKMPADGIIKVHDRLRGDIEFKAAELDDHVLVKASGMPTYQFANVVDDHLMKIDMVVRGEEWIPSLPKNIALYGEFGWDVPEYVHLPLMLNKNGGKLSKRQGDVAVEDFLKKGYLPDAIINFCALQGWHPKEEGKEVYSIKEAIKKFNIDDIGTSGAVMDTEKLDYLNGYYIRQLSIEEFYEKTKSYLSENINLTSDESRRSEGFVKKVIKLEQERIKKLSDISEVTRLFFVDELDYEKELLLWKKMTSEEAKQSLTELLGVLDKISPENWTKENIEEVVVAYIKSKDAKVGNYLWPMRASLTGATASPGPFEVAEALGSSECLKRITSGIKRL